MRSSPEEKAQHSVLTVDGDGGGLAEPLGGDVLGDAGIVGLVPELGLADEQVALARHEQRVLRLAVEGLAVAEPVDPGRRQPYRRQASQLRALAGLDRHRVRRRLELFLQNCGQERKQRRGAAASQRA